MNAKVATENQFQELQKLSTENLIIWVVGKSLERRMKLSIEEIALECWLINPEKHSLRGYPQFPDSFVVMKRIFDMKGRKGLIVGTTAGGFKLTETSRIKFNEIEKQLISNDVRKISTKNSADRTLTSIDEAPYKRLIRTPAYLKFKEGKLEQIVESDYLYFYGVNWHVSRASIQGKIRNVETVVSTFSEKDPLLKKVRDFLNVKFENTKQALIK